MNTLFNTYLPDGFHTVNSYLFVENPRELIDFLGKAFLAEEINRTEDEQTGEIRNIILKIGDSCIMLSQAKGQFAGMRGAQYLFVNNVDRVHSQALNAGGKEVFPPVDMEYGDRQSGIIDPAGNYWWISMRLEEKGYGNEG